MAVVDVVDVGVVMNHSFVTMRVGMGHPREFRRRMLVLMVVVMGMFVRVLQSLMLMQMFMPIGREQEGARGHGPKRQQAPSCNGFVQKHPCENRGETGRECEQHPGLDHSEVSESPYEQSDRETEGHGADDQRGQETRCGPMPESAEPGGQRKARDSAGQPLDRDDLPSVTQAHALR